MLNKVKKSLSFAVVLAMVLSFVLAGCGTKESESTDASNSVAAVEPSEASGTQEQLEPVELSWYYFGNAPGAGQAKVEEALNSYLKDKINATIKFYPLGWDEFKTKTGAMTAANEPFDIEFSAAWIGFADNAAKNAYLDITDLFPQYCPETKALLGDDFLKGGYYDGKLLAVPTNKEKAHQIGLLLNKALVEKYNMDLSSINGIKDLEPFLKTIKDGEPGITPLQLTSGGNLGNTLDLDYAGGDDTYGVAAKPGETKLMITSEMPETIDIYKLTRDWYLKGYTNKDAAIEAASGNTTKSDTARKDGKIFAFISNTIPGTAGNLSNDNVQWVQKDITQPVMANKDMGGSMNSISATSKNPERALMFLELVNNDKTVNNLIAWGIEGTNYTKVSDNVIHQDDKSDYVHTDQWVFGNQFINYLKDTEPATKWEDYKKFNDAATPAKSLGFTFTKVDELKSEIAACKLVMSKGNFQFGVQDVDKDLPKLVDQLKKAGIEKIISTMQTEYDAWLAR